MERVVAALGRGVIPAATPLLRADDLGVLRGDGVFETTHVRDGRPWLLDEHLDRMTRSASRMALDLPPRADLLELADQACAGWVAAAREQLPAGAGVPEGALKIVCTRGPEDTDELTCFATVTPVSELTVNARRTGVRLGTLTLGIAAGIRSAAPWLLGGVKSLSYAVNMACQRWAAGAGLDDVLWVSADGYLLEAPTATLVWLENRTLYTVPDSTGILAGTTARWLLDHVGELGWHTAERMVRPAELERATGVWLTSSVRGIIAVRELDGVKLADPPQSDTLREMLGYPA
ncbi:MAG: aminotransferase class IV [Actinocatenispora sp.]